MSTKLTIANEPQLTRWMNERRKMGRSLVSIKGPAPDGATYDGKEKIELPVNIAWQDMQSGEVFAIEYETPATTH